MPLLLAAAVAGTALQTYSAWKQGQEQARSLLESANLQREKAKEIIRRNDINNDLLLQEGKRLIGSQLAATTASGITVESNIALFEETAILTAEQIKRNTEVAHWEARAAMIEANSAERSASEISKASKIAAVGSLFLGVAKTWDASPGRFTSNNQSGGSFSRPSGGSFGVSGNIGKVSQAPSLLSGE